MAALDMLSGLMPAKNVSEDIPSMAFAAARQVLSDFGGCQADDGTVDLFDEAFYWKKVPSAQGPILYRQRIVVFRGWKGSWQSKHSLALASQAMADHRSRAPNVILVIVPGKVTKTAMNMGADARRCRVLPFAAKDLLEAYFSKPRSLPRRVSFVDAFQDLGQDAFACPPLLATDFLARLWLWDATVGDAIQMGVRDYRIFTQEMLPEIFCSEP